LIDRKAPDKSVLVTKGIGMGHGGGASIAPNGTQHQRLLAWISGGAPLGQSQRATPVAPTPTPSPSPEIPTAAAEPRSGSASGAGGSPGTGRTQPLPSGQPNRGAPPPVGVQWADASPSSAARSEAPKPSGPT